MTQVTTDQGTSRSPCEAADPFTGADGREGRTLFEALVDSAAEHANRQALVADGREWTYAELVVEVEALGAALHGFLQPGDRVILQGPNRAETVLTTLACFASGVVPVWALPQHRELELTAFAEHTGARAIVTSGGGEPGVDHESLAHAVRAKVASLEHVIVMDHPRQSGSMAFGSLASQDSQERPLLLNGPSSADALAVLIPSGGTTGASKIVPRTHNDLGYMLRQACRASRFDRTSRYLAVLPLGHGFVNTGPGVLGTLMSGGTVILSPSSSPEKAFPLAVRHEATATSVVPAVLQRWVDHARAGQGPVPSFVLAQSGAAFLPPDLAAAAEDAFECTVQQVYGMSEGLTCVTRIDDPVDVRRTTQGWPLSTRDEMRVVDDHGQDLGLGRVGTLLTRGPYTIGAYYQAPETDRVAFTADGWYITGDLAVLRQDGRVSIQGRTGDTINRGGEKVSAAEVEHVLLQHEDVDACAVVAMPDPVYGQDVCAFIVPCPGRELVNRDELAGHLTRHGLAPYKAPRAVLPLTAIPLTGIGKVDRRALRAQATREAPRPA